MIQHAFGLLAQPRKQWHTIAGLPESAFNKLLFYPCIMALLPAVAWYWGTTHVGWTIGNREETVRLTTDSAAVLCFLLYLGILGCIAGIGYFIHWMADTYGADSSIIKGVVISGLVATPLYLSGLIGFYPVLSLDLLTGVLACAWTVYLLYLGIPIVMHIPEERGFLFSSAVIAISLVIFICLMVITVLLWEFGVSPTFTD